MNDAQTWTLIAGFLAITVAMNSLMLRVFRAEIGGLRTELKGEIGGLRTELKGEISGLRTEVRSLDRDVQVLFRREFGGPDPG